jgi:hypothetical protein
MKYHWPLLAGEQLKIFSYDLSLTQSPPLMLLQLTVYGSISIGARKIIFFHSQGFESQQVQSYQKLVFQNYRIVGFRTLTDYTIMEQLSDSLVPAWSFHASVCFSGPSRAWQNVPQYGQL